MVINPGFRRLFAGHTPIGRASFRGALPLPDKFPYNSALSAFRNCCEAFYESAVVPQVRKEAPSRLQGRASSRQGFRDLQEQPAFQGAPALRAGNLLSGCRSRAAQAALFLDVHGWTECRICRSKLRRMSMDGRNARSEGAPDIRGHSLHPCGSNCRSKFRGSDRPWPPPHDCAGSCDRAHACDGAWGAIPPSPVRYAVAVMEPRARFC